MVLATTLNCVRKLPRAGVHGSYSTQTKSPTKTPQNLHHGQLHEVKSPATGSMKIDMWLQKKAKLKKCLLGQHLGRQKVWNVSSNDSPWPSSRVLVTCRPKNGDHLIFSINQADKQYDSYLAPDNIWLQHEHLLWDHRQHCTTTLWRLLLCQLQPHK